MTNRCRVVPCIFIEPDTLCVFQKPKKRCVVLKERKNKIQGKNPPYNLLCVPLDSPNYISPLVSVCLSTGLGLSSSHFCLILYLCNGCQNSLWCVFVVSPLAYNSEKPQGIPHIKSFYLESGKSYCWESWHIQGGRCVLSVIKLLKATSHDAVGPKGKTHPSSKSSQAREGRAAA